MADNRFGGGLFSDYQRPPPRASTALGLMSAHSGHKQGGANAANAGVGTIGAPTTTNTTNANTANTTATDFSKVIGGTVSVSDEVRATPQYADWYYAQTPRDPRTPPPLIKGGKYGANVARASAALGSAAVPNASFGEGGGIPLSQPPSGGAQGGIPLSTAPKAAGGASKYQPPSQRGAGPAIPLAKAPGAKPSPATTTAPAADASNKSVTSAPSSGKPPMSTPVLGTNSLVATNPLVSAKAHNATTSATPAGAKANNNASGAAAPATTQRFPGKPPSSIPDGEERWTDELMEEMTPPKGATNALVANNNNATTAATVTSVPRPNASSLPSNIPAPPTAAAMASQQPTTAATTTTTAPSAGTVVSGGQQFSLYARPFQPGNSSGSSAAMMSVGMAERYAAMTDESEESQYYAAMRSLAPYSDPTQGTALTPNNTSAAAGIEAQGFTPYPQYNYGGRTGNSPHAPHGGGVGGGADGSYGRVGGMLGMMDAQGYDATAAGWYGGADGGIAAGGYGVDGSLMPGALDTYGGGGYGAGMGMRGGRGGGAGGRGGRGGRGGMMGGNPMGINMGGMSPGPNAQLGGGGPQQRGGRGGNAGGGNVPSQRSPFVEKFHAEHVVGMWRLNDVEGHIAEIAKDQEGSRFVQVQLDAAAQNGTLVRQLDEVLNELFVDQSTSTDVICDVFGNYVVQKILDVATEHQLAKIFNHLRGIIVNLTLQTYGCRVIQKAVESLRRYPVLLEGVVAELEPNVPRCVQDQNGNHVIQKLVEINPDGAGFIIDAFRGKVRELATHAYGCRVIQCILSQCPRYEPDIMRELFQCLPDLTMDQYGNYVVQHVLQHGPQSYIDICFDALKHRIYYCSRQKFASNVIEKLFHRCTRNQRQEFFDILCYCDPDVGATEQTTQQIQGKPLLSYFVLMMMDPFANYVVQKFVDEADEPLRRQMMNHTLQYLDVLKAHHYGMHIINRFERSRYIPQGATNGMVLGPNTAATSPLSDRNAHHPSNAPASIGASSPPPHNLGGRGGGGGGYDRHHHGPSHHSNDGGAPSSGRGRGGRGGGRGGNSNYGGGGRGGGRGAPRGL